MLDTQVSDTDLGDVTNTDLGDVIRHTVPAGSRSSIEAETPLFVTTVRHMGAGVERIVTDLNR